ncbi:MAG: DNA-directed RNA polymerase subunit K [Candidatus Aenigmarchaeota archaeon]|nr:DNA-directed RNA polymerase subunit K [Candidatus Aenigmarchaeota archaeon]
MINDQGDFIAVWPEDRLTRFEVARVIGARSLQISLGAPLLIKKPKSTFRPVELAKEEFKQLKVPMTIKRTLPSGKQIVVDIKTGIKNWLDEHNGEII